MERGPTKEIYNPDVPPQADKSFNPFHPLISVWSPFIYSKYACDSFFEEKK